MSVSRGKIWLSALLPVVLLAALLVVFWKTSGGLRFEAAAPVEQIAFERIVFKPQEGGPHEKQIVAHIRNVGPEAVTIAHVQVGWLNRASWEFRVEPSPTVERLATARVHIPYPWNTGEPYEVVLFTEKGLPFSHKVEVAAATPEFSAQSLGAYAMLGVYVGVIPVFLGILWLPFLRSLGERGYGFLLSLTVGLLVFLGVDALSDALETGAELPGPFQGVSLILMGVAGSMLLLSSISAAAKRRRATAGGEAPLLLAYLIAFGIGVHNLGEGLAIGGAYALGEIATGALLIIGFMIHNLTEGIAVVAPIVRARAGTNSESVAWTHLLWLGTLAGAPTILGSALGAFAPSPVMAVLFLAVGAGAVFQVVMEITAQMSRRGGGIPGLLRPAHVSGFLAGLAVMYATGLFLAV